MYVLYTYYFAEKALDLGRGTYVKSTFARISSLSCDACVLLGRASMPTLCLIFSFATSYLRQLIALLIPAVYFRYFEHVSRFGGGDYLWCYSYEYVNLPHNSKKQILLLPVRGTGILKNFVWSSLCFCI